MKIDDMVIPAVRLRAAAWPVDRNTPLRVSGVSGNWASLDGYGDFLWPILDLDVVGRAIPTDDGPVMTHLCADPKTCCGRPSHE